MKLDTLAKIQKQRQQNNQREPRPVKAKRQEPTAEQQNKGKFVSAGMAYRRVPVLDTLLVANQLSKDEHRALSYYRDQASLADKSPIRSNCDFSVRGGGNGPGVALVSAMGETARIERELGQLLDIARAVAVDDMTIRAYYIDKRGKIPTGKQLEIAGLELRMAAHRINTEILR